MIDSSDIENFNLSKLHSKKPPSKGLVKEFVTEQAPLIVFVLGMAFASAYLQHGFLLNEISFPLAGVTVPIWHLIWMGFWTGYTMAIVGEAAGIFALPYTMSVLMFSNSHVTPTTQLLTLVNPLGALFGFWRNRQMNFYLALYVCLGGIVGGLIGPFIRVNFLSDVKPFTLAVGLALVFAGSYLCFAAIKGFRNRFATSGIEAKFQREVDNQRALGLAPSGIPPGIRINTFKISRTRITIEFWDEKWDISKIALFSTGIGVGIISAALGVGGGFLLVPIFAAIYGLPMYVLVAATIPYVIVLSGVGIFTYSLVLPLFSSISVAPEWSWGFFAASGGILGSWGAAKTQKFVPEHSLKIMLGSVTGIAGFLFVLNFFIELPFRL